MSSPFAFDEDSDEADSVGKNIPMPPDSSSEDSESSSVSSKSAGSDEYNFDSNAFSSRIKRMKRQKDRLQDIKKQKTDLDNDVLPKRNEFNEFDDDFDDDADENAAAVAAISAYHSTRPAFCSRNLSQDSNVKPSQSYLSLDTLRVNKMATNDSVEDNQYQVSVEEDALSHTDDSLRRKREQLNKKIQAEPQNVDLWLEFIKFQDVQCSYEKLNSSGSSSSSRSLERVYADKKMSILDKALKINPGSEQLCNTRYKIMIKTQPTDRVLQELKVLLGKQRSNMYLHRQYLRLMQHNMNRNTVEALCEEYHHAIQMSERKQALSTLLEFGTFLKQAGLWEILLSVLQQYLEENLKTKNFDMGQVFELKDASEEEEQKFLDDELAWVSKLDTMELSSWVRVEQERSDAHFMPVNTILTCIDDTVR
uniref:Uncharacterized protein n=1 Tax=Cacopsylla melanoneura TaxID=428564 RepID=A0A8D8R4U9_9HEMI